MATKTKKEEVMEVTEDVVEETKEEVAEVAKTDEAKKPGKVREFLGKAGKAVKKALPYAGAAVAGAAVATGAIIVAVCKGASDDVPALEKDDDLIPADEFIDGEAVEVTEI